MRHGAILPLTASALLLLTVGRRTYPAHVATTPRSPTDAYPAVFNRPAQARAKA